jgi:hypothetical protein
VMAQAQLASMHGGPPAGRPPGGLGLIPARQAFEAIGYAVFGLFIFLLAFDISEPSPYDFLALPTVLPWLALGVRMPRDALLFAGLLLVYCLGLLLALLPFFDQPLSVLWVATSAYLAVTAVFFAMFFSDDTTRRIELALKALTAGCLVAAAAGVAGYFDLFGTGELFAKWGRAAGTFKDPNVFGSFLVFGILYLVRGLATGEGRRPVLALIALPLLLTGVLLSFSRGSWMAAVIGVAALLFTTFAASRSGRVRRRIALLSLALIAVGMISTAGLLAIDEVRSMAEARAQVQDYDVGETGRFGNQLRAIPLLLERPNGFGPLRFRATFDFEPHNSYLGAFANGGWITGLAFIALMLTTTYVGLRLCLRPSPYQRAAQVVWAMQLVFFVQSFQIDIDHWRHAFLAWGMIWGLEAARRRWLADDDRQAVRSAWAGSPGLALAGAR